MCCGAYIDFFISKLGLAHGFGLKTDKTLDNFEFVFEFVLEFVLSRSSFSNHSS